MTLDWSREALSLAPQPVLKIDQACDRFEDAWQATAAEPPPRIEDFLDAPDGPERCILLRELLALELEYRRDRGESPTAADYLERFPDQADQIHAVLGEVTLDRSTARDSSAYRTWGTPDTVGYRAASADTGPYPQIRGFEILGELGTGGMGVVYRARQLQPHRVVALKTIRAGQLASPADVERFRTEAENAAGLDHDHIVPIYEVGEDGGQHFFSMKLMEGGSLAQRLKEFGLPAGASSCWTRAQCLERQRQIAGLLSAVARAVYYAHRHGLLHRDLKPANILLDARGQAHVTDFGLAKRVEGEDGVTQSGALVGTPAYMAPEQAAGRKSRLTVAVDVYGLGAILYHLLGGRAPFHGTTPVDTVLQVLEREPERPRRLNAAVNQDLETICLKCLEKDPARRYKSAEALAEDLERWLAGEPIRARRAGVWERAVKWARRRPAAAALAGVSVAAVLSLVVLVGALWRNAEDRAAAVLQLETAQDHVAQWRGKLSDLEEVVAARRNEVQKLERIIQQEGETARKAQLATRKALYTRDMQLAQTARDRGETARLLLLLNQHQPPPGGPDLRGFEWHHLWHTCHHERFVLTGHRAAVASGTFALNGQNLITADGGGQVRVWDVATGKALNLHQWAGAFRIGVIAADGKTAATGKKDGSVQLWDLATGKIKADFPAHQGEITALAFAPGGDSLATGSKDRTARVWDLATLRERCVLRGHSGEVGGLIFSADGALLATCSSDRTARVWELDTAVAKAVFTGQDGAWVLRVAFSPDGKTWATAEGHPFNVLLPGRVRIWDVQGGARFFANRPKSEIPIRHGGAFGLTFSPDGKLLAAGGNNGTVWLWEPARREFRRILDGHTGRVHLVAFSPDGRVLATSGNDMQVRIWDLTVVPPAAVLRGQPASVSSMAFSPNGRVLASASDDGMVRLWDVANGRVRAVMPGWRGPVTFSPNGKMLAVGADGLGVRLWDVEGERELTVLRGHRGRVTSATFSPDSKMLATSAHDHTARLWDVATGEQRAVFEHPHNPQVWSVAFTPDGQTLVSSTEDGRILLWDLANGKVRKVLCERAGAKLCVSVSPDGRLLAAADWKETVWLWELSTGVELAAFRGHARHVIAVAFTPDSRRLASSSEDGTVKLWDVETLQEIFTFRGNTAEVGPLAFRSDGKMLAAGADDGTIRLWSAAADNRKK